MVCEFSVDDGFPALSSSRELFRVHDLLKEIGERAFLLEEDSADKVKGMTAFEG